MNKVGYLTYFSFRTYSRKLHIKRERGNRNKLQMTNNEKLSSLQPEQYDYQDLDEFEGNFMRIGETHIAYEKEKRHNKRMLMNRIVASKYFKEEKQPNFLTYIDKQKIRELHKNDPEMWTCEKLSDSFPALPSTIKKIIKSNWIQDSVDKILQYDAKTAENWEQFRKGKLPLSESLRNHLLKFKDRKIQMTDRRLLAEKLVPPEIRFPKPKSTMFSDLMKDYMPEKQDKQLKIGKKSNLMLNHPSKTLINNKSFNPEKITLSPQLHLDDMKLIKNQETSNSLLIKNNYNNMPKEPLDTHPTVNNTKVISKEKSLQKFTTTTELSGNSQNKENTNETSLILPKESFNDSTLSNIPNEVGFQTETKILSRKSKVDDTLEYMQYLKIPTKLYKKGMTYRVKDCYYDDDGEFLYRVPGIKH